MNDVLAAVAWGGANLLLAAAAWRFSRWLEPLGPPSARIVHAGLFFWAAIVAGGTCLGAIGWLRAPILLGTVAAISLLVLLRCPAPTQTCPDEGTHRGLFWIAWGLVTAWFVGFVVTAGLLKFPTNWDTLMYHLPLINQWLQDGSLLVQRDAVWYNPGTNEMLGLWLVAPFSGDFLIALNNLLPLTLLFLASMELCRCCGLGPFAAFLGGLGVLADRVIFQQVGSAKNDLAVAALFMVALQYGFRQAATASTAYGVLAGIAVGLLAGTKYYAAGYALVAGLAIVMAVGLARGPRFACKTALIVLALALLFGGYWYLRNFWLTGTPIYPKGITRQTDVLSERRDEIWSTTLLGNGRPEVFPLLIKGVWREAGPCAVTALLGLALLVALLLVPRLWTGAKEEGRWIRLPLVVALLGSGLIWAVTPFAVETTPRSLNMLLTGYQTVRFGLSFVSLSVLALLLVVRGLGGLSLELAQSRGFDTLGKIAAATLWTAFAAGTAYQLSLQLRAIPEFVDSLLVAVNIVMLAACVYMVWPARVLGQRLVLAAIAGALLAGAAWGCSQLEARWHAGFASFYDKFFSVSTFHQLSKRDPETTRIAVFDYRYYPYFGSRRQFRAARPQWILDFGSLREFLLTHDLNTVSVVVTDPFPDGFYHNNIDWVLSRPDMFRKIIDAPTHNLFAVDVDKLRTSPP